LRVPTADAAPPAALSVGTLNLWGVWADWPGRLTVLLRRLPAVAPDVLALQEVVVGAHVHQAETLAELLGYPHVCFLAGHEEPQGTEGLAVLSRHPLRPKEPLALPASVPRRRVLQADVVVGGGQVVRVRCAHTVGPPGAVQDAQVRALLRQPCCGPTVLLGDFNQELRQFAAPLASSPFTSAVPDSAPPSWPMSAHDFRRAWTANLGTPPHFSLAPRRLDHILVHRLEGVRAAVDRLADGGAFGSDHALVRADLAVSTSRPRAGRT